MAVGETARLFVFTGLEAQEMVLEIYRDGRRVERREIGAGRSGLIEIPITAADRGGFGVTLTLVRDHQLMRRTARSSCPGTTASSSWSSPPSATGCGPAPARPSR